MFQQWDGYAVVRCFTDWIAPDQAQVRPLVEASAAKYAQEKGITPWMARRRAWRGNANALGAQTST